MFIEQLMRYGQRVQQERLNSQQSLFGGGSTVDIQPPTVPVAEDWNQLMLLNKEREVIGLYLSAHPLDDYKVIINHMCKSSLADLADLESLNGQEIGFAGVVTSVQEMTTKTGRHWGKFTMEDYNSTHEFALFGKDYENFRQYLFPNYFLFVKGKVQPRPYGDNPELEFKIVSMVQLSEVQDSMIKELHVHLPIEELTQSFVTDFAEKVKSKSNKKANIILRMTLSDRAGGTSLNMYSKRYKIILEQDFIDYLDRSGLKYTLS
jgi:DNA polymerase-3 subunit alpha